MREREVGQPDSSNIPLSKISSVTLLRIDKFEDWGQPPPFPRILKILTHVICYVGQEFQRIFSLFEFDKFNKVAT